MVNRPKLEQMLGNLQGYLRALTDLAGVPTDEFLSNADKLGNAKYHLVIAIECCIDIANHIISSEGFRIPISNADSFTVLVEQGILPTAREQPLRAMAHFRNRLVHLYWDVDDERLRDYLQSGLADLATVGSSVATWLIEQDR